MLALWTILLNYTPKGANADGTSETGLFYPRTDVLKLWSLYEASKSQGFTKQSAEQRLLPTLKAAKRENSIVSALPSRCFGACESVDINLRRYRLQIRSGHGSKWMPPVTVGRPIGIWPSTSVELLDVRVLAHDGLSKSLV